MSGAYAAMVGDAFRATSTNLSNADELASAAFQAASTGGAPAVLLRFVGEVLAATAGQPRPSNAAGEPADSDDRADDDAGPGSLVPIGLLLAGGAAL